MSRCACRSEAARTWYAAIRDGEILEIVLGYDRGGTPLGVAQVNDDPAAMQKLIRTILPALPARFSGHFSKDLGLKFFPSFTVLAGVQYTAMHRSAHRFTGLSPDESVRVLSAADASAIEAFYSDHYPDASFHPALLETGQWLGIEQEGALVAIGGVHVFSPVRRVAVLGGIAVHTKKRGKGLGARVTQALGANLKRHTDDIGLLVLSSNHPAANLYRKLGFQECGTVQSLLMERRPTAC